MSLAASPNRREDASFTLKDVIGRYSRRLGQSKPASPLTERRYNNSRNHKETNSLAITHKDLRSIKENVCTREAMICESLRNSAHRDLQQTKLSLPLERELVNYQQLLHILGEEKSKLAQRCQELYSYVSEAWEQVGALERTRSEELKEREELRKQLAMNELTHMYEMKLLEMRVNSMDSSRQVGVQTMKYKEELIEQLKKKLLLQYQDYTKLSQVNSLLKAKLNKEIRFVEEAETSDQLPHAKQGRSDELESFYREQISHLTRQLNQSAEAYQKGLQCSKVQMDKLANYKEQCEKELDYIKSYLHRLYETYRDALAAASKMESEELQKQLSRLSEEKHQYYEQLFKQLLMRLSKQPPSNQRISKVFDREVDRLRHSDQNKNAHILRLQNEVNSLKGKLGYINLSYDLLCAYLKHLRLENDQLTHKLREVESKLAAESNFRTALYEEHRKLNEHATTMEDYLVKSTAAKQYLAQSKETLETRLRESYRQANAAQCHHTIITRKWEAAVFETIVERNKLAEEVNALRQYNSIVNAEISSLKQQLQTIPKLIEEQCALRMSNLEAQRLQLALSQQQTLSEKESLHCRLRTIERYYERLRSEMVDMEAMLKIAGKVQRRYCKEQL